MESESGERQFSRYACSPNELGYCGPDVASGFEQTARGNHVDFDFRQAASEFSGVWIYLTILGKLLGRDPLDPELVRGYWIGNELIDSVDKTVFWNELISVIGARAGTYWKYLDESLASEAAPTHAFHVLGIYPWTRLLNTGRPEPVDVLTSCCIRPGQVVNISEGGVSVEALTFTYTDGQLRTDVEIVESVPRLFGDHVVVGDWVALHWKSICDIVTKEEAERLKRDLVRQLQLVNSRVSRA